MTSYITLYLLFVIAVSLLIGLIVLRLKLPSPRLIITLIVLFILSPLIGGYFYLVYFDSLPATVTPDVSGLPFAEAKARLEAIGLKAREAGQVYESRRAEGAVVSQRPEAGRQVKIGRVVNLMLSGGKRKVTVPNLVGRPLTQADEVLMAAELRQGEIRFEQNASVPEGTIIAQDPLGGEEAGAGGGVDLLVTTSSEVITEETTEGTE
ncbi:MAG: PASTA domain-containing protein [Candidatus Margulisbacteria bacterium]|jgi:serine/threonine-protein kinase|nr:PASTA domain-containing protein [Candidatus Margulisiibacteriota bacterium]